MIATIERTKYNPEVKEFMRWTAPVAQQRSTREGESQEEYREQLNGWILTDFYAAVEWVLSQGYEYISELASNTISPVSQNMFLPLREYRVKRNGHYKSLRIHHCFLGGCCITESAI